MGKFSIATVTYFTLSSYFGGDVSAFSPHTRLNVNSNTKSSYKTHRYMSMDMDAPPAPAANSNFPVIESRGGAPVDVRYSDFLRLVNGDRIEKVTFSADGTKLLGVDTDGVRVKIEALPNDPDLLTALPSHKVDVTVLPNNEAVNGLGELAQSLIFPAVLFAGLFFP